jgi:hypothetical protein
MILVIVTSLIIIISFYWYLNYNKKSNQYEYGFELKIEKNLVENYSLIIPINEGWENFIIEHISILNGNCSYFIENTSFGKGLKIISDTNLHLKLFEKGNKPLIKFNGDLTLVNNTNKISKGMIFCDLNPNNSTLQISIFYDYLFSSEYKGNPHASGINQNIVGTIINGWQEINIKTKLYG